MRKCPDAFEEQDNDNAQLLLDNLDLSVFEELNEYFRVHLEWCGR